MTDIDPEKLKIYYCSLEGQKSLFDEIHTENIIGKSIYQLIEIFIEIEKDFPDLIPKFDPVKFHSHRNYQDQYYNLVRIKTFLTHVIAILKVKKDGFESTPVIEIKNFTFISDPDIKKILERDFTEIQKGVISNCWKTIIILCGGSIEAILLDLLQKNKSEALGSSQAPSEKDVTRWDLEHLIKVAVDLKMVSSGIEKLSHSVREYRNIIHPGNEVRNKLIVEAEEAKIAVEVLKMLYRDLTK